MDWLQCSRRAKIHQPPIRGGRACKGSLVRQHRLGPTHWRKPMRLPYQLAATLLWLCQGATAADHGVYAEDGTGIVFSPSDAATTSAASGCLEVTCLGGRGATGYLVQAYSDGRSAALTMRPLGLIVGSVDVSFSFVFTPPPGSLFPYSYSSLSYQVTIEDLESNVLHTASFSGLTFDEQLTTWRYAPSGGVDGLVAKYSWAFAPGHYALPSTDPACASALCLGSAPATNPSATISISATVPEPSTYALLLAGLGLVAVAARRRK